MIQAYHCKKYVTKGKVIQWVLVDMWRDPSQITLITALTLVPIEAENMCFGPVLGSVAFKSNSIHYYITAI